MSSLSQKEYLKKYLAIGKAPGTKKKKKKSAESKTIKTVKIIDDDELDKKLENEIIDNLVDEDAPQIVAVIDERPPSLRVDEKTKNNLWIPIGSSIQDSIKTQSNNITNLRFNIKSETTRNEKSNKGHSISKTNEDSPARSDDRDISPPRKRKSSDDYANRRNLSPPRKRKSSDDYTNRRNISPPRKSKNVGIDDRDISPPRKYKSSDHAKRRNPSPPRKSRKSNRWSSPPPKTIDTQNKMTKTLDGKSAGLQNAQQLNQESEEIREKEEKLFINLPTHLTGKNAETVIRDRKTGRVRDLKKEAEQERLKKEKEAERQEMYSRWGKGLTQVEERNKQIEEELHEMSKPLARYADDADLEKYLKNQEREGDPMLAYIRSKKRKNAIGKDQKVKPQFEGEFMPNRFRIRPGHRWDGVDRSNGYEKKWFDVQNAKKAQQEETYKWSTEDM